MKHFPIPGSPVSPSLAVLLGCLLSAYPAWAVGNTLNLPEDLGPDFLIYSAQGYLGVSLDEIPADRINALRLKDAHGAEVVMVDHDAPAGKSGLKIHDVILQLDGQSFDNVDQLKRRLRDMPAGRTVSLLVSRDGNPITITVQLCDRAVLQTQAWSQHLTVPEPAPARGESFAPSGPSIPRFLDLSPKGLYVGVELNPVRTQLADYFGVSSGTGLLVENVDYQSPAARAGLKAGDVVVKVESEQMTSRNDWLKAIHDHRGQMVQVTVMRNKQELVLTMSAGKPKNK
jgi:S1-C subfamily serine protease